MKKKSSAFLSVRECREIAIATISISIICKSLRGGSIRQCANPTRVGRDVNIYDDCDLGHQDCTNQYAKEIPLQNIPKHYSAITNFLGIELKDGTRTSPYSNHCMVFRNVDSFPSRA